jgi:peptidoglycan/LPS O-acetylase OafA/YrhL
MNYRADIDGLRALAVVAIVAFHLGISTLSAGFIGVDIFYVISGFLIGGIVTRELGEGTFSLGRFYQRRLRRIVPALAVMLIVTTLGALIVLLPTELSDYASSMIATTLWVANIYFWQTADYFADAAGKPLLHTWSLGVEEQYYLFFPLFTMLIFRLRPLLVPKVMVFITAASFALSVALTKSAPMANFYLLPTRAWELLLGVVIAMIPVLTLDWRPLREAVSFSGLVLIVASMLRYDRYTPFPGLAALPSCLGTAAVIAAGSRGNSAVGMLLSSRPFVFFGLISYSLYLWHWPIIVLMLQGLPADHLNDTAKFIAGALSVLFAVFSWYFIEKPFRASKAPLKVVFLYTSGTMISLIVAATILIASRGLPSRYDERVAGIAAVLGYSHDMPFRSHRCLLEPGEAIEHFDRKTCLSENQSEPNVLLIGDSHAAQLWHGLQTVFVRTNVMQATVSNCRPFFFEQRNIGDNCNLLMGFIYDDYLTRHRPDLIILAGLWYPEDEDGLARTLEWLQQRQFAVLLAGPDPTWYLPLPKLVALAEKRDDPGLVERHRVISREALDARFAALAAAYGTKYVSIYGSLCTTYCRTLGESGLPLMFDYGHLTAEGSELVAKQFSDLSLRR